MSSFDTVTIAAEPALINRLLASLSMDYVVLLRLDGCRRPAAGQCDASRGSCGS